MLLPTLLLSLAALIAGQDCSNYGTPNGTACACPIGFGGPTCENVACGGTPFDGSLRPITSSSGIAANLTSDSTGNCDECADGWMGVGCNVCTSTQACQDGLVAAGGSLTATTNAGGGRNNTLVCSSTKEVWASGMMSCAVDVPTIKAVFPRLTSLNLQRTLSPPSSPLPSSATESTLYAQLFYDGTEQFFCEATSCTQLNRTDSLDWSCPDLRCTCIPDADFCGGGNLDLSNTVNGLTGPLDLSCPREGNECKFQQQVLQNAFGARGLALTQCGFGECVRQSVIDGFNSTTIEDSAGDGLGGGVIAGLAVVGSLVGAAILLLLWGFLVQRKARRRSGSSGVERGRYGVTWRDVGYAVPSSSSSSSKKGGEGARGGEKTILDLVSGTLAPGQMMAVLGPSGAGKTTLIEILAGKSKSGLVTGSITYPSSFSDGDDSYPPTQRPPRIAFVPQSDILDRKSVV